MSDLPVIPSVAPASIAHDMASLLFDALDGDDTRRAALLLSFMFTDPERTAKLAQFEQDIRRSAPLT